MINSENLTPNIAKIIDAANELYNICKSESSNQTINVKYYSDVYYFGRSSLSTPNVIKTCDTKILDTSEFHHYSYSPSESIKVYPIPSQWINGLGQAFFLIQFDKVDENAQLGIKKEFFIITKGCEEQIKAQIEIINSNINSTEHEIKLTKKRRKQLTGYSIKEWDGEGEEQWEKKFEGSEKNYREKIHPLVKTTIAEQIKDISKDTVILMEIGGGKGILAAQIIEDFFTYHPTKNLIYIFNEPGTFQCQEASVRFNFLKEKYASRLTVELISTLSEDIPIDIQKKYLNRIDAVINCGGPLNSQIVPYEISLKVLALLPPLLINGGKIVMGGMSNLNITKKDCSRQRLQAINFINGENYCYVYEKTSANNNFSNNTVTLFSPCSPEKDCKQEQIAKINYST